MGGGDNNGMGSTSPQQVPDGSPTSSSSPHVSPTNIVVRRAAFAGPLPTPEPGAAIHVIYAPHIHWGVPETPHAHHRRRNLNRALM